MDVYLCNYSQDNSNKVRSIAKDFIAYFEANIVKQIEVEEINMELTCPKCNQNTAIESSLK